VQAPPTPGAPLAETGLSPPAVSASANGADPGDPRVNQMFSHVFAKTLSMYLVRLVACCASYRTAEMVNRVRIVLIHTSTLQLLLPVAGESGGLFIRLL